MSHKMQIKVTTELWKNAEGKHLNLVTDMSGQITSKVIALEEQATIDALVRLGWTPPDASHDDKYRALEAENERLRNVLEFYADYNNHMIDVNHSKIDIDGGKLAREALEKK
jgi:hypothetical protein